MHIGLCLCDKLPRLTLRRTRVVLVIHRAEDRKSTNTGRLALACLPGGRAVVRGEREGGGPVLAPDDPPAALLFPHADAEVLTRESVGDAPVTLVVPDGTWRQASKVRARIAELAAVRTFTLPPGPPSRYRLRAEAHPHAVSTIEAIARALGVLESEEAERALMGALDAMVARTLWVRGDADDEDVPGGLPPTAQRHAPRSGLS